MNDIVLNGETLEIGAKYDTIVIEGFDRTFKDGVVESKLVIGGGSSPGPGPEPEKDVEIMDLTSDSSVEVVVNSSNTDIKIDLCENQINYIIDYDYTDGFIERTSINTKTFDSVKAGDVILLLIAHRANITVPSDFILMKKMTYTGQPQYNSIYTYEVQNDLTNYSVIITQSSNQKINYYIAIIRGANVINNISIDRLNTSASDYQTYTMTADHDLSDFLIFYSCVYSKGDPVMGPAPFFIKKDLDTNSSGSHRMAVFTGRVKNIGNAATISNMGEINLILGIIIEGR